MIPGIFEHLDNARREFAWRELWNGLLPCATVLRWRARSRTGKPLLEKAGPKKKEPNMRELHAALDEQLFKALQAPFTMHVELATHQLNHRSLRSLARRTPYQFYYDPAHRIRLHGAPRQRIFREVFDQFWHCLQCMPDRNRHNTTAAWRSVVEAWLRRQGWITVKEKQQPKVSTDSEPLFSQN